MLTRLTLDARQLVRRRRGVIALVVAVAILVGGVVTGTRSGLALSFDPRGAGCRSFWGETVTVVSWSRDGGYLAVASTHDDGAATTRVFEWPGMRLRTIAHTDVGGDHAAIGDDGTIYWTVSDPFSQTTTAMLWRQPVGGGPEPLGVVDGRYLWLTWAGGSLVATEVRSQPEASRLVRLSVADPGGPPEPLTDWMDRAGDTWIDRTGGWIVWVEPNVPSDDPEEIVVRHGGEETRVTLPGYGGGVPTIAPAHDAAIYQRSETARLTVVDLATGALRGELDEREFYGGEISSQSILAAPTAHGPWQTNELCVLDVGARLADLGDTIIRSGDIGPH